MSKLVTDRSARLALASLTAAAAVASIHHVYRLGPEVAIPAVIITSLPYLLLRRYGSSGSRLPLWSYAGLAASIFVWFGFVDGFLDHVLKALGLQHTTLLPGGEATVVSTVYSLWSSAAGNLFYEGTGILEFAVSAIAIYHCYRLLRSQPERTVKTREAAASGEHLMTPTTAQTIRSAQLVGSPPEVAAEGLAVDTLPALEKSLPQLKGRT